MELTDNAREVLKARILQEGETYEDMCKRVSSFVAKNKADQKIFYDLMYHQVFLPNSPCLTGAGTDLPQLFACFVLPVTDSMDGIFDAIKQTAAIHKSGGGTGFDFSELRPAGSYVRSTRGVASGPVSFMKIFNMATEQVKQGGRRKGANMGILRADHPDIFRFLTAKSCEGDLNNFNLSVALPPGFFENYTDHNRCVLEEIAQGAWANGEPGVLFLDRINQNSPHPDRWIAATNPCGEFAALPYEPCVLGSINVSQYVLPGMRIDWGNLKKDVGHAVRFLDDCIDVSQFPLPEVEAMAKHYRKIGLGIMGLGDLLFQMRVPYNSIEGRMLADRLMCTVRDAADDMSHALAHARGVPPGSKDGLRNAARLANAPTGTLSLIANCSAGIEPVFSLAHTRNVLDGKELVERNPHFRSVLDSYRVRSRYELPKHLQDVFVTAMEMEPEDHIHMQAVVQAHIDQGVSKTINLPKEATAEQIRGLIQEAWKLGCKGVTFYRDGSRESQVYCKMCD